MTITEERIMSIVNQSGDTKIKWHSSNADEVENARNTFDEMTAKGFIAFADVEGQRTIITEFNPDAEKMLLTPPMVAG